MPSGFSPAARYDAAGCVFGDMEVKSLFPDHSLKACFFVYTWTCADISHPLWWNQFRHIRYQKSFFLQVSNGIIPESPGLAGAGRNPPQALGGCVQSNQIVGGKCKGQVYAFDVISHGWDAIEVTADSPQVTASTQVPTFPC